MTTWITVALISGTALFLYFYHVRTRRFDSSDRKQVTSWRWYEFVDWYLKISSVLITVAAIHWQHPILLPFHDQPALRWIGLLGCGAAILLFAWAMTTLDRHYTPAHVARLPKEIVTAGPYRFIRHPIYTSNLLLLISLTLTSGSLWLLLNLVILIAYYVPTIRREEKALAEEFDEYRDYMKRTGRILPRFL